MAQLYYFIIFLCSVYILLSIISKKSSYLTVIAPAHFSSRFLNSSVCLSSWIQVTMNWSRDIVFLFEPFFWMRNLTNSEEKLISISLKADSSPFSVRNLQRSLSQALNAFTHPLMYRKSCSNSLTSRPPFWSRSNNLTTNLQELSEKCLFWNVSKACCSSLAVILHSCLLSLFSNHFLGSCCWWRSVLEYVKLRFDEDAWVWSPGVRLRRSLSGIYLGKNQF